MAVVTRFLDAANRHDADTLYATVHPEFESFQPLHPARNFRGPGQLISNWKAIFEAEPGFRLTVLRASTTGNTVWVEVHGAGDTAEAAGIFIVGVENSRIRWVRVYSDLVEPPPEKAEDDPAAAAVATPDTVETPGPADKGPVTVGDDDHGTVEPATAEPAASEPDAATPEPDTATPEPVAQTPEPEPVAQRPEPPDAVPAASGSSDLQAGPDAVSPSDIRSAPGDEGMWAAADNDSESPTPAAPSADASPWLVEAGGGSPDGPDDESPAPPEPGLRLVAPAPLPDTGAGPGATMDETTVETLVGSAIAPTGPPEPGPTTDREPAAAGDDGAVTDDAEPPPAGEAPPADPPPDDGDASGTTTGETDPAAPEAQPDEAASADEDPVRPSNGGADPERPSERGAEPEARTESERPAEGGAEPSSEDAASPSDDPGGPPWLRMRRALGMD